MPDNDDPGKGVGFAAKGPVKITITVSGAGMSRSSGRAKGGTKKKRARKSTKRR